MYKKITELTPKIVGELDKYYGFFFKHDKKYKRLNPIIYLNNNYKTYNIAESLFKWHNKNQFNKIFDPLIKEIENILININQTRFENDKKEMIKIHNYMWASQK